ncbi:MAG: dTMP kinase [Chlamydiia bacterium]|nr:dTMP kinase [Chlamydiia bacterium]
MSQRNRYYEGLFVTLEGGDGCGKSTLATHLRDELEKGGYQVVRTREPGGTPLAEHIRNLLLSDDPQMPIGDHAELLLFLAARAQHIQEVILPGLRNKKIVICERFNDSTIAYQGFARHMGHRSVEEMCALACDHLVPDCTFFLDLDPALGLKRISKETSFDRLEQENLQFHKEVRQAFLHLADQHSERMIVLDASQSPDQLAGQAMDALRSYLTFKSKAS